jgi:toxin secretion/phage lysis holin
MEQIITIKKSLSAAFAVIGSFVANQLGGWDAALIVLIGMMAIDYLTGLAVGAVFHKSPKTASGRLVSAECFKGLIRKCTTLLFVWIGAMLDQVIGAEYVRTAITLFFIASEGLSILENTALMGIPYPAFLKRMLEVMKEKNDGGDDSDKGGLA